MSGDPSKTRLLSDTGKPPVSIYCSNFLDKQGILSLSGGVCTMPSLNTIYFSSYHTSSKKTIYTFFSSTPSLCSWGLPLLFLYTPFSSYQKCVSSLDYHLSLPKLQVDPTNATLSTAIDYGTLYLAGAGGDNVMMGG